MLTHRLDLNELRSNAIFKNKRYSLQRESSLERRTLEDTNKSITTENSNENSNVNSNENNNADTDSKSSEHRSVDIKSHVEGEDIHATTDEVAAESEATGSPQLNTFPRSASGNMLLRASGLHARPMSLNLIPRVLDIDATTETTTETDTGSNSSDLAVGPEQDVMKKKKKGIFSAVTNMSTSKLRDKFDKMTSSKLRREDKYRKDSKSSSDMSPYISPRSESSPEGSPPVSMLVGSPESMRHYPRLSRSGSPHSSPLLLPRHMNQSPTEFLSGANGSNGVNALSISADGLVHATDDPFPGPLGEEPARRGKKLEKFFGDVPTNAAYVPHDQQPASPSGEEPVRRGKKLEKLLGDVPTNVFDRNAALECDDEEAVDIQEEGVIYNPRKKKGGMPVIKAATMQKLVERLTHPSESDPNFLNQYLLTYRTFTTPQGLLDLLKARFQQVIEAKESDSTEYTLKNKQVIRLRLFNMIKSWLQHHWIDFQDGPELIADVMKFSEQITRDDMNMAARNTLVRIVTKNTEGERQKTLIFSTPPPKSHIPSFKDKLSLSDIHPEEFARQITLLEYDIYKAIKPWELLMHTQGKKSTNIVTMINQFNDLNKWVQTEILKAGETPKQRASTFGKLLEICEHLKLLNNYNALMEIISGINASPIFRLKLTWAALGSKQADVFNELNTLMSGNGAYKALRNTLHTIKPPCIPYMGMYLTDLTFINDGNPQYLDGGYINFDKCRRLSAVIQEIIQYQQTPYCLSYVDEIQQYLKTLEFERDENKIYQLSLQLEERGSVRM